MAKRLTPNLSTHIIASIRAGGYPHVAAQSWGVSRTQFDDWLERGTRQRAREPYRSFAAGVAEAQAQARLRAEVHVFENEQCAWLEHGPGKATRDSAGWSRPAAALDAGGAAFNPFLSPEFQRVMGCVLNTLAPHPQLRESIGAELENARRGTPH
jgi:hypothetical protein